MADTKEELQKELEKYEGFLADAKLERELKAKQSTHRYTNEFVSIDKDIERYEARVDEIRKKLAAL